MNRNFASFTVEIANEETINQHGIQSDKKAKVKLLDIEQNLLEELVLPYISADYLQNLLSSEQAISLQNCYIDNFNVKVFKDSKKGKYFPVNNLQLTDCFINSESEIDLRGLQFNGLVNFSHSIFAKAVDFTGCKFNTEWCDFDYAYFTDGNVSFSGSEFVGGQKSFKNVKWGDGKKDFQYVKFNDGYINFINTEWNNGDVIFSECIVGQGKTSFKVAIFGDGRVDFSHSVFSAGDLTFEKAQFGNGNFNFRQVLIGEGKTDFNSAEFGKGAKNFAYTDFGNGSLSFKNVNFGAGKISFKYNQIGVGKKDFHFAKIKSGDIIFERVQFASGIVDFRAVDFGIGKVLFNRCEFTHGDVIFEACELSNNQMQISNCVFDAGNLNIDSIVFGTSQLLLLKNEFIQGKLSAHKAKINILAINNCQIDNYADLRVAECNVIDLSESIIKGIVDIQPYNFNSNIGDINLNGLRLIGRIYLDWERSGIKQSIARQDTSIRNKAEQYRVLKENYNAIGQYEDEDSAYVEFKRYEAKAILQEKLTKNLLHNSWYYMVHGFKWLIFDKVGLYATNPVRVLLSMVVTYLIFTGLYIILPWVMDTNIISSLFDPGDPRNLGHVPKAFYHSAITFLTIGYGDYYPSGFDRWLSSIEGFIGLFLMSYFTVAFVRKILR